MEDGVVASHDLQKELLGLSPLSDVVVHCGEKKWNLHGAILAHRSQWFNKALLGGFQEAKTKTILIEEFDEDFIEVMIEHIYNGSTNWKKLQGERSFTGLCMDVFNMADYFLLPDLGASSQRAFGEMLLTKVPALQTRARNRNMQTDPTEMLGIFREVYAEEASPAGKEFRQALAMALHSIWHGVDQVVLAGLLDEKPTVAADVLKFALLHRSSDQTFPYSCPACGHRVKGIVVFQGNLGFSIVSPSENALNCVCYCCDGSCKKYGPWKSLEMTR
ncbi:hypothetical protein F5Y12DRAFT_711725 [Xylaria sp. FL1777]|nr:hypothetical protein F5Y12DRAFT_711725 [Xylaria sp. FL1777]